MAVQGARSIPRCASLTNVNIFTRITRLLNPGQGNDKKALLTWQGPGRRQGAGPWHKSQQATLFALLLLMRGNADTGAANQCP